MNKIAAGLAVGLLASTGAMAQITPGQYKVTTVYTALTELTPNNICTTAGVKVGNVSNGYATVTNPGTGTLYNTQTISTQDATGTPRVGLLTCTSNVPLPTTLDPSGTTAIPNGSNTCVNWANISQPKTFPNYVTYLVAGGTSALSGVAARAATPVTQANFTVTSTGVTVAIVTGFNSDGSLQLLPACVISVAQNFNFAGR